MVNSNWIHFHTRVALAAFAGVFVFISACETTKTADRDKPSFGPSLRKIQAYYPELASGRFVCLGHFEAPEQAALFRIADAEGGASYGPQPTISVLRARDETGSGGLYVRVEHADDIISLDGVDSPTLGLRRDWQGYSILLFSIYGPREGVRLRFSVNSGTDVRLSWHRLIDVGPGWNQFRFDTSEIADVIDIADVRSLQWQVIDTQPPVDLFFDDVILGDNSEYLHGKNVANGQLYSFRSGRRIHVGAKDRFEIAIADGQIVAWYPDSSTSQTRRLNLAPHSGLGPHPVMLPQNWFERRDNPVAYDDPTMYQAWGNAVFARQWIEEMTDTRIILDSEWQYPPTGITPTAESADKPNYPSHGWRYVIYPTGEVFITVRSTDVGLGWPQPTIGYAVSLLGRTGFDVLLPNLSDNESVGTGVLLTQSEGGPDLVWAPHTPALTQKSLETATSDDRLVAVTLGEIATASDIISTSHLCRFWPNDMDTAAEQRSIAADYQNPARVDVLVGTLRKDAIGDANHDGYNESEGCFELAGSGTQVRFGITSGELVRHAPRFRISGTRDQECWIYVAGKRFTNFGRDRNGDVLFTLPTMIGSAFTVEIHCKSLNKAD